MGQMCPIIRVGCGSSHALVRLYLFTKRKWNSSLEDGFIHCLMFSKDVENQNANLVLSWMYSTNPKL